MKVEHREYTSRQQRAIEMAKQEGYAAIIAWSRGGSTQDHYANVYYLTGFYTNQPFVPDKIGIWRAAGHTAFILPVDAPSTLLVDMAERQDPQPVADKVLVFEDLIKSVADTVKQSIPPNSDIALLGTETIIWKWGNELKSLLSEYNLIEADDFSDEMRLIKSDTELNLMRKSGSVGVKAVEAAMCAAVVVATEADVAAAAIGEIITAGGAFYGMGLSSGEWAHTFAPSTPAPYSSRVLKKGEMLRLDIYGSVDGYIFDFGRSRIIGKQPTIEQQEILNAVVKSVQEGMKLMCPGNTLRAVARRCEEVFNASDYVSRHGVPRTQVGGDAWGHGIGLDWGEPWIVTNSTIEMRPGMCFAIERRIEAKGIGGANYENNIIITEAGCENITPAADFYNKNDLM